MAGDRRLHRARDALRAFQGSPHLGQQFAELCLPRHEGVAELLRQRVGEIEPRAEVGIHGRNRKPLRNAVHGEFRLLREHARRALEVKHHALAVEQALVDASEQAPHAGQETARGRRLLKAAEFHALEVAQADIHHLGRRGVRGLPRGEEIPQIRLLGGREHAGDLLSHGLVEFRVGAAQTGGLFAENVRDPVPVDRPAPGGNEHRHVEQVRPGILGGSDRHRGRGEGDLQPLGPHVFGDVGFRRDVVVERLPRGGDEPIGKIHHPLLQLRGGGRRGAIPIAAGFGRVGLADPGPKTRRTAREKKRPGRRHRANRGSGAHRGSGSWT